MKRVSVLLAAAVAAAALTGGSAGAHEARYESKVTMKDPKIVPPKRGTFRYAGKVTSERPGCFQHREVTLWRRSLGSEEPTQLATDESDNKGRWGINWDVNNEGNYFATVSRTESGSGSHEHVCKPDKSNVFKRRLMMKR